MLCGTGREAASRGDGNPPSTGELPPGGMQILIDPECHEITITTNPQSINHRASSSNRTGEASGSSAINRNDAADTGEEEAESDSDTRRYARVRGHKSTTNLIVNWGQLYNLVLV